MEELSPEQIETLKLQRRAKFEQMGVKPTFSQEEVQKAANYSMGAKNLSARDKINAIKNGALKEDMREFNRAISPAQFESIPTPRQRRSPEQQKASAETAEKLGLNKITKKKDLDMYEAMFDTDSSYSSHGDVVMGNDWNKRKELSIPSQQQSNDVYISEDSGTKNLGGWEDQFRSRVLSQPKSNQPIYQQSSQGFDLNTVEKIINETVDRRMKDLISEMVKMQNKNISPKNELTYKRVRGSNGQIIENFISIGGKIFKIEEVKRK